MLNTFGAFCYRCAIYGTVGGLAGNLVEKQFLHNSFDHLGFQWQPIFFTNVPRIIIGQPMVTDYDQYHQYQLIKKYLPNITEDQFTTKHKLVSEVNSAKANQIL